MSDGKLCFATEGSGVAVTDGTPAGTAVLLSTAPGLETGLPREMTAVGKRVFFNAYDEQNGICIYLTRVPFCGELWTSDGTVGGTRLLKDLVPGSLPGAPEHLFASSAGRLYFAAGDPTMPQASQAWVSDGTAEGTRVLSPKISDRHQSPRFLEVAGRVFFTMSDGDLFETDGTPEGTRSLRDRFALQNVSLYPLDAVGGRILMRDHNGGRPELWSYDGMTLEKITEIPSGSYLGYLATTGRAWFATNGGDLWSTDGTAAGTGRRFSFRANGASMYPVAVTPTRLYYGAGDDCYMTDGTEAGTHLIDLGVRVADSTWPGGGKAINGRYFFEAPVYGKVAFSDGTEAGTVFLRDGRDLFAHEGQVYFNHHDGLWRTDGTPAGTIRASDWLGVSWPKPPAFIGEQAIFAGGVPQRAFRRDPDGSLHDLQVDAEGFQSFVAAAGGVAFLAWSPLRLMFTDGTAAGTRALTSGGSDLVMLGRNVVYGVAGATDDSGLRLWFTDFTPEGTRPIKDLSDTGKGDALLPLFTWRNLAVFRIQSYVARDLWRSDGTAEGTFQLATGRFDAVVADADELVLVRFTNPGYEIWTSDGTAAGTKRRDVYSEGLQAGEPFVMPGVGVGVIYRTSPTEVQIRNHRTKAVHVIDTRGVESLAAGIGIGDRVFFSGYRGATGYDLWAVKLDGSTLPKPTSVRIEYVGTATTATGTGAVFRVHADVAGGLPSSVTATTVDGSLVAGRDYVPFTREIVFENDHAVTLLVPLRDRARGTMSVALSAPVNATVALGLATADVSPGRRQRSVRH